MKKLLRLSFYLFNTISYVLLIRFFRSLITKLPDNTQLFISARQDFGTHLHTAHYSGLWEHSRGPTACIILTAQNELAINAFQYITPQSTLIACTHWSLKLLKKLYGNGQIQYKILNKVYAQIIAEYPKTIFLFDTPMRKKRKHSQTHYIQYFDPNLSYKELVPKPFLETYIKANYLYCDTRNGVISDYLNLYNQTFLSPFVYPKNDLSLLKKLGIRNKYVLLTISRKNYHSNRPLNVSTRKGVQFPDRYNVIIDTLIQLGFDVVLHGRDEVPYFEPRKGLVDYSKSIHRSFNSDCALFSHCTFAITSKTGPENFCTLFDVPMLGLNYTELVSMTANVKARFYPKDILDTSSNMRLSWPELLQSPAYFDIGSQSFLENIEYIDMTENEMLEALEEFLPLVNNPVESWLDYTPNQLNFKKQLTPLHLDLYNIKSVPCETYLSKG